MPVNRRRPSGTMAMPWSQNRLRASRVRSRPCMASDPPSRRLSPAIALISVVLPAPFGPTTHTSSPASMRSEMSQSAGAAP